MSHTLISRDKMITLQWKSARSIITDLSILERNPRVYGRIDPIMKPSFPQGLAFVIKDLTKNNIPLDIFAYLPYFFMQNISTIFLSFFTWSDRACETHCHVCEAIKMAFGMLECLVSKLIKQWKLFVNMPLKKDISSGWIEVRTLYS